MAQEPGVSPASGYECFIRVYNKTNVDIGLNESKIYSGSWAPGRPPNTIEAGNEALIQLNDNTGMSYILLLQNEPQ